MDLSSLDHEAVVTPYQLCHVCKPIADLYVSSWEAIDGMFPQTYPYDRIDALPLDGLLEPSSPFRRHHATFEDLHCAAVGGCHLCAMFVSQVENLEVAGEEFYIALHKDRKYTRRASVSLWCAATSSGCTGLWSRKAYINMMRTPHCRTEESNLPGSMVLEQKALEIEFSWCTSTGSKTGLDMAAAWLRECVQNHVSCKKNMGVEKPTRLLALGAFLGSKDLKLVHSTKVGNVEYAALSYTWGDRVTTTLKATNVQEFMLRIPFNMLPTSVQEAVKVCKSLGISYLWVDALCIVQENRKDFAQEISRMGSIYAGSILTIAAADSLHCDSGLFRSRWPLACEDLMVEGHATTLRLMADTVCHMHPESLSNCALSSRAWTCQERVLAPRTIHFDADEIIWECRQHAMCHRCAGRVRNNHQDDYTSPKREISNFELASDETAINYAVQRMWSRIVKIYTPMQLSNEDDRLSALAGLAQLIYDKSGFNASYGLWLPFFADELLWHALDSDTRQVRNADLLKRIPSWSWASCRGRVRTFEIPLKGVPAARKVLYRCDIKALPLPTPFGPLSSLSPEPLRVSGWLTLAVADRPRSFEGSLAWSLVPPSAAEHEELGMPPPAWPWPDFIPPSADSLSLEPCPVVSWEIFYWPDKVDEDILGQRLLCLTVKRHRERKETFSYASNLSTWCLHTIDQGLVLRMVDTEKRVYRRIGYFRAELPAEQDWAQEKVEVTIV